MESVAKFVVSAVELAEAELRTLQHSVTKFGLKLVAVVGAGILGLMGVLFLFRALYLGLEFYVGPIWALAIVGGAFVATAAVLVIFALHKAKPPLPTPLPSSEPATATASDKTPMTAAPSGDQDGPIRIAS